MGSGQTAGLRGLGVCAESTRLETAVAGCSTVGVERTRIVASVCELRYPVNGRSRAARALDRGHHLHNGPLSALDNLQLRIESCENLSIVFLSLEICERLQGTRGCDEGSGATGMLVTVRVADSGA